MQTPHPTGHHSVHTVSGSRGLRQRPYARPGRNSLAADAGAPAGRRVHDPRMAELPHLADDRQERTTLIRQLVLDARRRFGIAAPHDRALLLEHVEPLRQRARADAGTRGLELLEATRPFGEIV